MNILEAIQAKGIDAKRVATTAGGEYASACPWCGGRDRFRMWPEKVKKVFWCRRCDKSGDLVQFYRFEGLTYRQACEAAGIDPKNYEYVMPRRRAVGAERKFMPTTYNQPSELWREHAEKFVAESHADLMADSAALDKLLRERGINAESVKIHKLGINRKDFYRVRESWGLEATKRADGKPKKLWIPRGLVIPCYQDEHLMRVRVRRPKDDLHSKDDLPYYFVPGSSPCTMGLGEKRRARMVVESELDAILVFQEAGDLIGLESTGNSSSKPDDQAHKRLMAADLILVALDYDPAGAEASTWWIKTYQHAERWPMAEAKDPGDYYKAGGDVRAWALAGLPPTWSAPNTADHSFLQDPGRGGAVSGAEIKADEPAAVAGPEAPGVILPETVRELGALLQRYPVRVYFSDNRVFIEEKKGWNNWPVSKRISQLVFLDPDCREFLAERDGVVNGENFFE